MEISAREHLLTEEEHEIFNRDGILTIKNALTPEQTDFLNNLVGEYDSEYRKKHGLSSSERLSDVDIVGRHPALLDLLDCPTTLPKVWGILGWNIRLYHSYLVDTPPDPESKKFLGWHQDSGRLNDELEGEPRPRISLKVMFCLSDTTETGRANFYVVPGSHLFNKIELPRLTKTDELAVNAVPVLAGPGDAVLFDRRIWHTASYNVWDQSRRVIFYGYSYRWLVANDEMTVDPSTWEDLDPIRRQLLGEPSKRSTNFNQNPGLAPVGYGFTYDDEVPLKQWIENHVGEHAVTP